MALPNWAGGIAGWAKDHKPQAAGIGAGLLFLFILLLMSGGGDEAAQQQVEEDDMFGAGALPEDATTSSALAQMERLMETLRLELRRQQEQDSRLGQAIEQQRHEFESQLRGQEQTYTDQLEVALEQAIDLARLTEQQGEAAALANLPPPVPTLRILRPEAMPGVAGSSGLEQGQQPPQQQSSGRPGGPWVRLPLGSTVTGELMTGAFATKIAGDALPVLVQLRSAYTGPNDTEIPLEDCLMIGKATADISSVRARVEAVSLSCVLPDGTAFERAVKGYFTGDDGTLGVPGKWEFRSGRWLANLLSAMGTVAAGVYADIEIAKALAGADLLGSISASDTTERIQDFFIRRAEEILPVVWIESGAPVYVVMMEGLTIEGLPAEAYAPVSLSVWD